MIRYFSLVILLFFFHHSFTYANISNEESYQIRNIIYESISGKNTSSKWKTKRMEIIQASDAMELFAEYNSNHYLIAMHKTSSMISIVYKIAPAKSSNYDTFNWRSVKNIYKQIPLASPTPTPTKAPLIKTTPTPKTNIISTTSNPTQKQLDPLSNKLPATTSKPSALIDSNHSSKNILDGTAKQECKNLAKFLSWDWLYKKCL